MNKTKATQMGKTGGNSPAGATLMGTDKTRVGGQIPSIGPLPAARSQFPYLAGAPTLDMPNPQDAMGLPMYNVSEGFAHGAEHMGDMAGGTQGSIPNPPSTGAG